MRKLLLTKIRKGGTTKVVINTYSEIITIKQFFGNESTLENNMNFTKSDAVDIALAIITYFNRDSEKIIIEPTKENKL